MKGSRYKSWQQYITETPHASLGDITSLNCGHMHTQARTFHTCAHALTHTNERRTTGPNAEGKEQGHVSIV